MIKLAVTAANGQLGKAIIKEAIRKLGKENVIGIARTPEKAKGLGVEICKGDYNNKEEFQEALKGVDVVLLVSGMDHPDNRVWQHRNVIEAAKENRVKKIVYTSIFGEPGGASFDAIIKSNRKTERDIIDSGMQWSIGRNGLYLEPDLEYVDHYIKEGKISNSAGNGRCGYTTREELAYVYVQMILNDDKNEKVFNLFGEPITQTELVSFINQAYQTNLVYEALSPEEYLKDRIETHGELLGTIISGIYNNIRAGVFNQPSGYKEAAGREHIRLPDFIKQYKYQKNNG